MAFRRWIFLQKRSIVDIWPKSSLIYLPLYSLFIINEQGIRTSWACKRSDSEHNAPRVANPSSYIIALVFPIPPLRETCIFPLSTLQSCSHKIPKVGKGIYIYISIAASIYLSIYLSIYIYIYIYLDNIYNIYIYIYVIKNTYKGVVLQYFTENTPPEVLFTFHLF